MSDKKTTVQMPTFLHLFIHAQEGVGGAWGKCNFHLHSYPYPPISHPPPPCTGTDTGGGSIHSSFNAISCTCIFFTENGTSVDIPDFFLTPTLMTNKTVKVNSLGRDQSELCFQSKIIYVS